MDWYISNKKKQVERLRQETNLSPFQTILLGNRDLAPDQVEAFLHPAWDQLEDPFAFKQMGTVVEYIIDCLQAGIPIRIVGDYDQDGVAATTILMKGIRLAGQAVGADPKTCVDYAIPDRIEDGYGINRRLVDQALAEGRGLIITCDNGIAAFDALTYAQEQGMPVLVTDHHQLVVEEGELALPPAEAILNPHNPLDAYPFPDLCGAGVAFKVVQALQQSLGLPEEKLQPLLAYAALGTICDMVPLQGENRVLASLGLQELNRLQDPGFQSLLKYNSWNQAVDAYTVGFVIGPCINASGRLMTARLGVELFLEEEAETADAYARELVDLNNERKQMTREGVDLAIDQVEAMAQLPQVLLLYLPQVHESLCGLVAGRIKDRYYRPCLVFTDAGEGKEGQIKGSGRSIPAYNMFEKMNAHRDLFQAFGGHAMACGLTLDQAKLPLLREQLNQEAQLTDSDLTPSVEVDCALPLPALSYPLLDQVDALAPFGMGNPRPAFGLKGANLLAFRLVGKEQNVLQVQLEQEGRRFQGVLFQAQDKLKALDQAGESWARDLLEGRNPGDLGLAVDLVYRPEVHVWQDRQSIQLKIIDLRRSR